MKKVVGTMLLGMLSLGAGAQNASTYGFQATAGTFTPIAGGTLLGIAGDDVNGPLLALPFSFNFCGTNYGSLTPNSNGWLSFGTVPGTIGPMYTNTLVNGTAMSPAIMPLWDDLDGAAGWGAVGSYVTTGTFPNRVITFEWLNYGWDFNSNDPVISVQCKLYETSNIIEFIYRQEANGINADSSATIGIIQNGTEFLTLDGIGVAPNASASSFFTNLAGRPASGQIYRFTPPQCSGVPNVATAATSTPNFPMCTGGSPSLTGSGFSTGNGIAYKWQGRAVGQMNWNDLSYVNNPSVAYIAPAIVNSWEYRLITYCQATGDSTVSNTVTVVVPSPTASFAMAADSVCSGTNAMIQINGTPFSAVTIDSAGTNITVLLSSTGVGYHNTGNLPVGSYVYTLEDVTTSCTMPLTGTHTVVSTPRPSGALTSLNPTPICNGATTFISVAPISSYTWPATIFYNNGFGQGSDTATGSLDNIAITPPPGTYTYNIDYIVDAQGCVSLPGTTPGTAQLTVNPTPTAYIAASAPTVCTGTTVTYTIVTTGTGPWTFTYGDGINDSTVIDNVNDSFQFTTPLTADSTIWISSLSDSSGCPVGLPADYNTPVTVTIGQPATIVSDPSNVGPICTGSSAMFMGSATGYNINYQWLENNNIVNNGGVYGGATSGMLTISDVSNLGGNTYSLVATGQCGIPDTSTIATLNVNTINTWNGSASTAWSNPMNWSCGAIPVITTDVVIPNVTNDPLVDIPGAVGNTLTIQSLASVAFTGVGNALELNSTITIQTNAIFNPNGGELILSGAGPQNIPPAIYTDLTLMGGGLKTLDGPATVQGVLNLNNGIVALGANDLQLDQPAATIGGNVNSYVRTNSTGILIGMNMGSTDSVTFHVGNSSYNPLGFRNTGVTDDYSVRVLDAVYVDGDGTNPATVGFPVVNRTWLIEEAIPGGSWVNMSPYFTPADYSWNFDPNWAYGAHHDGTMWESLIDSAATGTPVTYGFGNHSYLPIDSLTSFSPYTVASGTQYPLAVTLSDINAANAGTRNKVDWSSSSEEAGSKYELQRSTDAKNFTTIATVNAKGEASAYTYWDEKAVTGVNYYRIKVVEADGQYGFSKVVSATVKATSTFSIEAYPNPVSSVVTVTVNGTMGANATVEVTDVTGKVIKSVKLESAKADINLGDVASGVYFVKYADDARQEAIKINKQ